MDFIAKVFLITSAFVVVIWGFKGTFSLLEEIRSELIDIKNTLSERGGE